MAASLLGTIEEYVSSDVIQRASAFLGESPENTEKAVQNAVPAVLGGLIQRASTMDGAEGLLGLVTRAAQSAPTADPASLLGSGASLQQAAQTGQSMLSALFGGKLSAITDLIAGASGIKASSASSLLSLLTPFVLSLVGREAATRGGGAAGLMSLLTSQKSEIMGFLPSGLTGLIGGLGALGGLTTALGGTPTQVIPPIADATRDIGARLGTAASDVGAAASTAASNVGARIGAAGAAAGSAAGSFASEASGYAASAADRAENLASSGRTRGWLLPAAVIALLALGAWYFLRGGGATPQDASLPVEPAPAATTPPAGAVQGAPSAAAGTTGGDAAPASDASKSGLDKAGGAVRDAAGVVADKSKAAAHEVAAGTKAVASKTAEATKEVAGKTADVSKDVARKTADVAKDAGRATADASKTAARKTADVTKEVAHKTADVTKEGASATADAAKKVGSATKTGATKAAGAVAGAFEKVTGREGREAKKEAAAEAAAGPPSPGESAAPDDATETAAAVKLPDGRSLQLAPGSASYQLAEYLQAPDQTGKTFVFERLQFHSGTTRLTGPSQRTVRHLSAILKAYPTTEVRLDGFTDNKGKADENQKLSQARADAVKSMLAKSGVSVTRLATAGYGADKPVASNDSADGRQQNRRIELVVTKR